MIFRDGMCSHALETMADGDEEVVVAAKLADDKMIFYLDIGPKFLTDDGTLTKEIMPDLLHLSPKGYEIWAEATEPSVAQLMGEK